MAQSNPFAPVRASDYTDQQINSLWVEIGAQAINAIIEPQSNISKYILGGKGTGKTHLLRYYSYHVTRLRHPKDSGISILLKHGFLAIFLRATGLDASRFEPTTPDTDIKWQRLFGVYLELRLTEGVIDTLTDIQKTSPTHQFDDKAFIKVISESILDKSINTCKTLPDVRDWLAAQRRHIDDEINNAAFTGHLNLRIPFSIGSLCLSLSSAIAKWNSTFLDLPLIYLIDEIENLSSEQQQVINSLVRYGEGKATFRVTGRLYARKTLSTLAQGEENREGSEFKTTYLDNILRGYSKYPEFAKKFVLRRINSAGALANNNFINDFKFSNFEELDTNGFYNNTLTKLKYSSPELRFVKSFISTLNSIAHSKTLNNTTPTEIADILTFDLPILIQKLNILLFCKRFKPDKSCLTIAKHIRQDSIRFVSGDYLQKDSYKTAYGHWAHDLFAQLCRESKKLDSVPYAGFDTFVKMSGNNPRNLLIILNRAYEIAAFKDIDFVHGSLLPIAMQTEAAIESARFMYERDSNYGRGSQLAKESVNRLAQLLRTARYALNIPEVSPLAVSFYEGDLTQEAKIALDCALNYSFIYEIHDGRPDRNSDRVNRKIQLSPMLSPKWGLPVGRRGDIGLKKEYVNAIFDSSYSDEFEIILNRLSSKWNNPFSNNHVILLQHTLQLEL